MPIAQKTIRKKSGEKTRAVKKKPITDSRNVNALQNGGKKYRSLFDNSNDAIFFTQPDGSILDANPAACKMFGYSLEKIKKIGRNGLVDITDPRLETALKKREVVGKETAEITMIRANGEKFPAEVSSVIFIDQDNQKKTSMIIRDITGRRQTEKALREQDILFKKLCSHVPGVIYQFMRKPDGTYCLPFTSENIKDVSGFSSQDVSDDFSLITRFILPEDLDKFISSIELSAKHMTAWKCEYRVQLPGQPIKWMLGQSTPEKLADGGITWHGFNTDVTEQKLLEETLRESEKKYKFLIENMRDILWTMDLDLRTLYVTPSIEIVLGFSPEERLRQSIHEQLTPYSLSIARELLTKELDLESQNNSIPERKVILELEFYHKNGSTRWLETIISGIRDKQGTLIGLYGVSRDITKRKKMQEALRESEQRFSSIIATSQEWIWSLDIEGFHTFSNPAVEKILGYTADEIVGHKWQHLIHKDDKPKAEKTLAQSIKNKKGWTNLLLRWRHKDGTYRYLESNAVSILDNNGTLIGLQGADRDITKRVRAENALKESESKYRELSIIDGLTQLYNSRHYYRAIRMEINRAIRYQQPLTILFIDLDNFKQYNDAHGHLEGDKILSHLGNTIKKHMRQADSAYRYGGEEFILVLPMTNSTNGAVVAERIRAEFKKENFSTVPGKTIHMTISVGIAQHRPGEDIKTFTNRADQLMYRAKQNGKDRSCSDAEKE